MAFTTIPAAGAKLRAATLTSLVTEARTLAAYKAADETITSNATLQDDDEVFVTVEANAVYEAHLHVVYQSGTTPDFKTQLSLPTGATATAWTYWLTGSNGIAGANASLSGAPGSGANTQIEMFGRIIISSTAGQVTWQWAQNTSDPGSTIARAGCFLKLNRIS